ncbi:hypothetical protein U4960_07045 [Altererythrobacter sp. H2]|uniref:DUF4139 domain-containing protein n=1 Tax=Altererythrobacter sp. H2 TaxID=3108391 RepID=UPI002B4BD5A4|nr:hypothetical protein [Altererythrobacter sp. H2]WRK97065.1 hypothetical protein U4960_07045 [Altererythrobacter sp. H2]
MRLITAALALLSLASPLQAREVVDASAPQAMSVTLYRDPSRGTGEAMNRDWPQGFAMISETRTVTLPPGESTVRFEGVAEGMVGVTAIVTGLPGGTIEMNRNAELLSPAALVNGALGNRVTITRTNPATGKAVSEEAVVRTRADGGLVLQTGAGFEAVRCAGLPEGLTFDRIPAGLSASPVFSIDTRDAGGGTYTVTLTYLAWGFDWQANYVATLAESRDDAKGDGEFTMRLLSWLTLLNDNGQSFPDAELMVIAGTLNVTSNYRDLAEPPVADPLRLTCYPLGSTAEGSGMPFYGSYPPPPPPPPPAPAMMADAAEIMVTGSRMNRIVVTAQKVRTAEEEQLGDLKLYRVPFPVTVAAKGLKQVAFLSKDAVRARYLYRIGCDPWERYAATDDVGDLEQAEVLLVTRNEMKKGLGVALPQGAMAVFEPGALGTQLVAETDLRDYPVGQDVELELSDSAQVFSQCAYNGPGDPPEDGAKWRRMRAEISNANSHPVRVRVVLGGAGEIEARWPRRKTEVRDGALVVEVTVPANRTEQFDWQLRETG